MSEKERLGTRGKVASVDPMFNAGIDYLHIMTSLLRRAHERSIGQNTRALFHTLENLYICVEPRIQRYIKPVKAARTVCEKNYISGLTSPGIARQYSTHQALKDWFRTLTIAIHKSGLLMQDRPDEAGATEV